MTRPWFKLALVTILLTLLTPAPSFAAQTQQAECAIGSSSSCSAMTPQEIYNLYGTTTDGVYWVLDSGTPIQMYLKMKQNNTANGSWVLMMQGAKGSTAFYYDSAKFTNNTSASVTSGTPTSDTTTDAKYAPYNDLPITGAILSLSNPATGSITSNGDIANNGFGGWVWYETFTSTNMYSLLTTNKTISNTYSTLRPTL